MVDVLLASGADANAATLYCAATPLMLASACGSVAVIRALVTAGADVNAQVSVQTSPWGWSLLIGSHPIQCI